MSVDEELRKSIYDLERMIYDVRRSIDRVVGRRASAFEDLDAHTRLSLKLEEARLLCRQRGSWGARAMLGRLNSKQPQFGISEETLRRVRQLLAGAVNEPIYQQIRGLPIVTYYRSPEQIWPQGYLNFDALPNRKEATKEGGEILVVSQAMLLVFEKITEIYKNIQDLGGAQELTSPPPTLFDESSDLIDIARLKSILPTQKIAPLQFEIVQDKLRILSRSSRPEEVAASPISAAKTQILGLGDQIVLELERSNCDRRLLEAINKTQAEILSEESIVRIAFSGIYCGNLAKAFQPELAGAVDVMLSTYSMTIGMYAAQFPEWRTFLENSASTEIDESDLSVIQTAIMSLADNLERNPSFVDPEVPRTLREIGQFIQHPRQSAKRMAFAAVRTAENLVISIWSHSADFLGRKLEKTKEIGSSVAARVVVLSLLVIALDAAAGIGPLTSKISEMNWMRSAIELVERQRTRLMQD